MRYLSVWDALKKRQSVGGTQGLCPLLPVTDLLPTLWPA